MLPRMLILALEQSTPAAEIALLRDGHLLATHAWHEPRKRDQNLFAALPGLLEAGGVDLCALDRIAVGLGPGSFSGVRIAIAAASALGLPDQRPVAGISSARALAWQTMHDEAAAVVTVVGDARRKRLWMATYEQHPGTNRSQECVPLSLVPVGTLTDRLPPACCIVSPDWLRLQHQLPPVENTTRHVIKEPRYPTARSVAQLAAGMSEEELNTPLNPPEPLYLHPAVFVPPRFPAS